jgi:hypothetical protein
VSIKPSGSALTMTEIQTEFGGVAPISLSEYYGLASGLPTNGPISMSTTYEKTFVVVETITASKTWTPKLNLARFIHIFTIGAGGSGGMGWPARNVGTFGNTDGVAGAGGGGAGGVSYSVIPGTTSGSATVTIGAGGTGVGVGGERNAISGNAGTASSFIGLGLNMTGSGGLGGQGSQATSGGGDSTSGSGGAGGSASGGNTLNLTGGLGGGYSVSGSDVRTSAAGGGAPRFLSVDAGTAVSSTTGATTVGIKVSGYSAYPTIATYASNRSQPFLGSAILSFDASDGNRSGASGSPTYGAGSGGVATESAVTSGKGGNGLVIIVYEI